MNTLKKRLLLVKKTLNIGRKERKNIEKSKSRQIKLKNPKCPYCGEPLRLTKLEWRWLCRDCNIYINKSILLTTMVHGHQEKK